jgi:hypothetical protein
MKFAGNRTVLAIDGSPITWTLSPSLNFRFVMGRLAFYDNFGQLLVSLLHGMWGRTLRATQRPQYSGSF